MERGVLRHERGFFCPIKGKFVLSQMSNTDSIQLFFPFFCIGVLIIVMLEKKLYFLLIALIHCRCCSIKASNKVYFHFYLERWPPLKLKANSKEMGIFIESW